MYAPGTAAMEAPFEITESNKKFTRISWEQTRESYCNRQYVVYGPSGSKVIDDFWTATAGQTLFPLHYDSVEAYWTVCEAGVWYPVGIYGVDTMLWTWDAPNNRIVRSSGATVGTSIQFHISVPFPQTTYADVEPAHTNNPVELKDAIQGSSDSTDYTTAQALATAQLTAVGSPAKRVSFHTFEAGLEAGQFITITLAGRHLSGDHLITSVRMQHVAETADRISYEIECVSGDYAQFQFLDTYRQWSGGGGGLSSSGGGTVLSGGSAMLHAHLGGSRGVPQRLSSFGPVESYQTFTCPLSGNYTFRSEVYTENAGTGVQVALYDVTVPASPTVVSGSTSAASTTVGWVENVLTVALVAGHSTRHGSRVRTRRMPSCVGKRRWRYSHEARPDSPRGSALRVSRRGAGPHRDRRPSPLDLRRDVG